MTEREQKGDKNGRISGKTVAKTGDKEATKRRQGGHIDGKTAGKTVTKQRQKGSKYGHITNKTTTKTDDRKGTFVPFLSSVFGDRVTKMDA